MSEDASAWILEQKSQTLEIAKVGLSFLKNIHPHNDIKWEDLLPTSVKVFPSPAGKDSFLPYSRSRAVWEREIFLPQKFSKPEAHPENHSQARSWKNKLWPIDVFHLHLSDKTRILRSNLSTKYLYICQRVLFKERANCWHIAYLCKVWTARWSMVLILVIQWKKTTCELVEFDPSNSSPSPPCSFSQLVNFPPQMHPASQPVINPNSLDINLEEYVAPKFLRKMKSRVSFCH